MKNQLRFRMHQGFYSGFTWLMSAMLINCFLAAPGNATVIDDVKGIVNSINSKVGTINTRVTDVQGKVNTLQTRVVTLQDDSEEIMLQVRDGVEAMAGNVRGMIDEAIVDVQSAVDEQLDGRDEFIANDAVGFREEIGDFFDDIESMVSEISGIIEIPGAPEANFDLSAVRAMLESVPDRFLYPMYKIWDKNLPFLLKQSLDDLKVMVTNLKEKTACDVMTANPTLFKVAAKALQLRALHLELGAKILEGVSEEFGNTEADVGIHGYAHVTVKTNFPKTFAKILAGISRALKGTSDFVLNKLKECEALQEKAELDAMLASILAEAVALEAMIDSRATQSSVDALAVAIDNINIDSRASQSSLDALAVTIDSINIDSKANSVIVSDQIAQHEFQALRIEVEVQLSKTRQQLAVFYLPESNGGLIELVRTVVSDTIDESVALGLYSESLAQQEFQKGEDSLGVQDFKAAFDHYRKAYQEIVRWPEGSVPLSVTMERKLKSENIVLNWNTESGSAYSVQSSTDMTDWSASDSNVQVGNGTAEISPDQSVLGEFYRVLRETEEEDE